MPNKIDAETLRKYLSYNPESGEFTWIYHFRYKNLIGKIAGCREKREGYEHIRIEGVTYRSHRLAWLYTYGEWPLIVDHINGIRHDNRIANLRDVSSRVNSHNKECHREGNLVGAHWHSVHEKWSSNISLNGKLRHLGLFNTEQEAHSAYMYALNNPKSVKSKIEEKVKSGIPVGIYWRDKYKSYNVSIKNNKITKYYGSYKTLEEAIDRLNEVKEQLKTK